MKKVIVCLCAYMTLTMAFSSKLVSADETNPIADQMRVAEHLSRIYKLIDWRGSDLLPFDVFEKAYRGYINLRNAGKLSLDKQILTVCDFALPSSFNRMWIIDLIARKVIFNTYVAHGQGSGEDCELSFSNKSSTHKSSLGFYVTKDTYDGEHGTSLHLEGMDDGFNDAAYERGIVVHGADYVSEQFVNSKERLGRSWGCPAVPSKLSLPIINTIKDGTCLFIYYPETKYLNTAYWLNKKVAHLPETGIFDDMASVVTPKPRMRIVQYITNGKVDSVKTVPIGQ